MEPGPALASPPETDQVTPAEMPACVAENCSTGAPEEFVVLQPVQLVSMVAVPGEMEIVLFDELFTEPPPQPASTNKIGKKEPASIRVGHWRINEWNPPPLSTRKRRRRSVVTDPIPLNTSSAFRSYFLRPNPFDAIRTFPASTRPGRAHRSRRAPLGDVSLDVSREKCRSTATKMEQKFPESTRMRASFP